MHSFDKGHNLVVRLVWSNRESDLSRVMKTFRVLTLSDQRGILSVLTPQSRWTPSSSMCDLVDSRQSFSIETCMLAI